MSAESSHRAPARAAGAARGAILAAPGASPATASQPDSGMDDERVHVYEANPAPWWIGVMWVAYFVFGATYLIVNLLR